MPKNNGGKSVSQMRIHTYSRDEILRKLELSQRQILIFSRDLARVYRAEKATRRLLQIVHQKLRAIVDSMSDGMLAIDERLFVSDVNKTFERVFNLSQDKLKGMPLAQVFSVPGLQEKLRYMQEKKLRFASLEWQPQKSVEQFYQVNISEIQGQKKENKGYVLLFRDITERKRLERLKSRFVTFASHEIRTPLHGLIGFLNLIYENLQNRLNDEEKHHFRLLIESGENLRCIIEEMLQVSTLKDDSTLMNLKEISVQELLQTVLKRISFNANAVGVEISLVGEDVALFVDHQLIAKAIESILKSIIGYANYETSIQIHSTKEMETCKITLFCKNIHFDDTDPDVFGDNQSSMDTQIRGRNRMWNLGFPLAEEIIQWHHGSIKVEKQKDKNSLFVVINFPISSN
ncbi:hypothetical protein DRQ00_05745 [candidate division KSB1 bacterium]|nr:MAG: hypothetical protein DRQ00_05745 [candidate division KSB1 bacterium]